MLAATDPRALGEEPHADFVRDQQASVGEHGALGIHLQQAEPSQLGELAGPPLARIDAKAGAEARKVDSLTPQPQRQDRRLAELRLGRQLLAALLYRPATGDALD